MRSIGRAMMSRCAAAVIALGCCGTVVAAQVQGMDNLVLRAAEGGNVRALIIGIDNYRHYRPLKGAVADARDIETALRRVGTKDITALLDAQADRAAILREIDGLIVRTRPNDLIVLSIAGHGTQEPERVKGSEPDGMENVFLLPGFEPTAAGSQQRILGKEFNHFIKQLELRGAHVLFVADTCHGGGMAREVDPRGEQLSYRQVPSYRLTNDTLKPVTTSSEAFTTELDFDRTEFLAAVDRKTKAPEVTIPGIAGLRGALSYAVARAIEGDADANADGRVTVKELFTTVRQMVYQLSNQRQNIVTVSSPSRSLDNDVVFQLTRGVNVAEQASPARPQETRPLGPTATPQQQAPAKTHFERPVRLAALDGNSQHFAGLTPREVPFEIVAKNDNPDIFWDPTTRDVIDAYSDVVAYKIDKAELPSVIDRAAAIRELKLMWTKDPQVIKVGPDDSLHRNESLVHIELNNTKGRALILFSIAGNGTVQMLYPKDSDLAIIPSPEYSFKVKVREPFGHDQIVAITSDQRMGELEQVLLQLKGRRAAAQMIKMVQRYAPKDARIGSAGLYTAP
jgi:Caspase domain